MTITDPISDLFARIRNGINKDHKEVVVPFSKIKVAIVEILKNEGFIKGFDVLSEDLKKKFIRVALKYGETGDSMISSLKVISKPSKRIYVAKKEIPKVLNGFGISIVSTHEGVLSGRDARLKNAGGELIAEVY
ncbi:MAG: small subunit ribosomal protein S8 [Candidatus Marinamargulisbacteria bacterium]|jgi:small subunit ribosomal protein S8